MSPACFTPIYVIRRPMAKHLRKRSTAISSGADGAIQSRPRVRRYLIGLGAAA